MAVKHDVEVWLQVFLQFFVEGLKITHNHLYKHEAANTTLFCLVKASSFSQKNFKHKIKRSQLWILHLTAHYCENTLIAIISVESDICRQACLFVLKFYDWDIANYCLDVHKSVDLLKAVITFLKQLT